MPHNGWDKRPETRDKRRSARLPSPVSCLIVVLACASTWLLSSAAWAEIPRSINFQGRLTNNYGTHDPVTGTHTLTFRI